MNDLIKKNQILEVIKPNQIIEQIKLNQGMGLIKSSHGIQSWVMIEHLTRCRDSWHLVTCPTKTAGIKFDHNSIMSRGSIWILKQKYNIN